MPTLEPTEMSNYALKTQKMEWNMDTAEPYLYMQHASMKSENGKRKNGFFSGKEKTVFQPR